VCVCQCALVYACLVCGCHYCFPVFLHRLVKSDSPHEKCAMHYAWAEITIAWCQSRSEPSKADSDASSVLGKAGRKSRWSRSVYCQPHGYSNFNYQNDRDITNEFHPDTNGVAERFICWRLPVFLFSTCARDSGSMFAGTSAPFWGVSGFAEIKLMNFWWTRCRNYSGLPSHWSWLRKKELAGVRRPLFWAATLWFIQ